MDIITHDVFNYTAQYVQYIIPYQQRIFQFIGQSCNEHSTLR